MQTTQDGSLRGKIAYMSPEQLRNEPLDARTDVWAAGVVLWEMIANARLFVGDSVGALVHLVMTKEVPPPSTFAECPPALDEVVKKALATDREERFASARAMSRALEAAMPPASPRKVAEWLETLAGATVAARAARVAEMERSVAQRPTHGTVRTKLAALGLSERAPESEAGRSTATSLQVTTLPLAITPPFVPPLPPVIEATTTPRRRSVLPWLALAATIIAVLIAWRVLARVEKPATSAIVMTASAAPEVAPIVSEASEPEPVVSATASAAPSVVVTTRKAKVRPATSAPPHVVVNCDPPYTIGPPPDLIKKPKLECLPP